MSTSSVARTWPVSSADEVDTADTRASIRSAKDGDEDAEVSAEYRAAASGLAMRSTTPLNRDAVVFLDKLLLRYDVLDRYFHTEGIACFRWRRKFPLLPVYDSPTLLREVLFPSDHLSLDAAAGKLLDRFLHLGSSFGGKILQLLAFLAEKRLRLAPRSRPSKS